MNEQPKHIADSTWKIHLQVDFLLGARRYEEALKLAREALSHDPDCGRIHGEIARCLTRLGRCAEAIDHGKRAVGLHPDDAWCWIVLAWAAHFGVALPLAMEASANALRLNPMEAANWNARSWILARAGDAESALAASSKGLELEPHHPGLLAVRARVYVDLKRWPELHAAAKAALSQSPDKWFSFMMLGIAAMKLEQYSEAENAFSEALKINPHHEAGRLGLSEATIMQSRFRWLRRPFGAKDIPCGNPVG